MLNLSCLMAVASCALLVATVVLLVVPRFRTFARRAAIGSAVVFLSSAAAFAHYSGIEARQVAGGARPPVAQVAEAKLGLL